MKIAIAQLDMGFEDKERAMALCASMMREAKGEGAELIVFPEMTLTGFTMQPEIYGEDRKNSRAIAFFREEAKKNQLAVCFGMAVHEKGVSTNHCILLNEMGEELADYAKIHPFSFGAEAKYYVGGDELSFCTVKGAALSPLICYDLRFPEPFQVLSEKSRIITVIASWPTPRREHWMTLLKARAIENQCFIVGVNRSGEGGGLFYNGDSMIVSPLGEVLVHLDGGSGIAVVDIDIAEAETYRSSFPVKADRKPALYHALWEKHCNQ